MNFLFVCTGNTCRSPMAAVIAESLLEERGEANSVVKSAGFFAGVSGANPLAIEAMMDIDPKAGEKLEKHQSNQIDKELVRWADHVLVMSDEHSYIIMGMFGDEIEGNDALKQALYNKITVMNIPDPFGGDSELYEKTRDWLFAIIKEFFNEIFGDSSDDLVKKI